MAATPFQITVEEFRLFHKIDRTVYSLLVIELRRDPMQSMQTLALWIWLERTGFNGVIRKILSLPPFLINELADEAATCLKCIEDNQFLVSGDAGNEIPLTQSLTAKELSVVFFHHNRDSASSGIRKIASEVCLRALPDIMEKAMNRSWHDVGESSLMGRMGGDNMCPRRMMGKDVPPEDRTMFVTFSKGYPVAEWEVREFFTNIFGDCIEYILMQEVKSNEQALYARIVFYTPAIIEFILKNLSKAKFAINGKHVWMRKFVPKNTGNSSS